MIELLHEGYIADLKIPPYVLWNYGQFLDCVSDDRVGQMGRPASQELTKSSQEGKNSY